MSGLLVVSSCRSFAVHSFVSTTITPPGPTATWSISLVVLFAPGTRRLFSTVHSGPSLLSSSDVQSSPNAPTRQEIDPSVVSKDQTTSPTRTPTAKPAPRPRQNGGNRVTKGIRPRNAMRATPPKTATTRWTRVFRKRIQVMRRAMVVSSRPGMPRTDAFRTEQQLPHRLNGPTRLSFTIRIRDIGGHPGRPSGDDHSGRAVGDDDLNGRGHSD